MDTLNKINALKELKAEEPTAARVRLEKFFDANSFVELEGFADGANVITGYGSVNGRLCFAYSQNGPVNKKHATKIADLYSKAINMGAPVTGILDSNGIELKDGQEALEAYGILFKNMSEASGLIPQISVILGDCLGIATYIPLLSDFRIMMETNSNMFMTSPAALEGADGIKLDYNDFCSGEAHATKTGLVHRAYKTEEDCLNAACQLIDLLPLNNSDIAEEQSNADLNREDEALNTIIADESSPIDMSYIISSISDDYRYFELQPRFGEEIICAFTIISGKTVGVLANNGALGIQSTQKAGKFVKICDAFNIPIVTLTDIAEYQKTSIGAQNILISFSAHLLLAFTEASVPKINIVVRRGIGSGYMLMNSKYIGADIVLAWPTAEISLLNKKGYVDIMHQADSAEYEKESSPYTSASKGYIDDIIIPAATRKHIIAALEMLCTKRVRALPKKHNSV